MSKMRIAAVLAVALLAGAGVAAAQELLVEAHVPFAFVVENTTLPQGDYVIERVDTDQESPLVLRSKDGNTSVAFLVLEQTTKGAKPAAQTELVFQQMDGKNYLNEIWYQGEMTGNQVVESRSFEAAMRKTHGESNRRSVKASRAT